MFPLGGQRGSVVQIEIRGKDLEGAYAVWFTNQDVRAEVRKVEEVKPPEGKKPESKKKEDKKSPPEYQALLQIEVNPAAKLGPHPLRLVSPRGVSNPVLFHIYEEPAVAEVEAPHQSASEAQPVSFPSVVNGRISTAGQLDCYVLNVSRAERLSFELITSREAASIRFRPQLALYELQGSWFDPKRAIRRAFTDQIEGENAVVASDPRERSGTRLDLHYQFDKAGRYYLEVGSLFGKGGLDHVYQVRIVPAGRASDSKFHPSDWKERTFTRKLEPDWLRSLWLRTVKKPNPESGQALSAASGATGNEGSEALSRSVRILDPSATTEFAALAEREPNEELAQALEISFPVLIEGVIERPNDVDTYKFKAGRGQRLAFEIETPETTVPRFNPLLTILDSKGAEVLTNIQRAPEYKSITATYLRALNPKVINIFEQEGAYYLRIRDVTSRNGDAGFRYRVLVRPQIPHVGEIELQTRTRGLQDGKADPYRLNLTAGQAKKLTLTVDHEEGFFNPANIISIVPEGLPEGISVFAAASSYSLESRVKEEPVFKEESFLAKRQNVTLVFQARVDAPVTTMPVSVRLFAQAIVDGKPGSRLAVREIPMMVVKPTEVATVDLSSR
ncbi:MAG: hypothetical protein EXQ58_00820 [Acidobacteria bacterium]|nr:hypothetical protein [Acidobacteriota bacterium]